MLLFSGLLATIVSTAALAQEPVVTTQQVALGQASGQQAMALNGPRADAQAPGTLVQENYATETNGRPFAGERGRVPVREVAQDRRPSRYVAERRVCAHLGCGGIQLLGVGF
jgi:hypothetical protein